MPSSTCWPRPAWASGCSCTSVGCPRPTSTSTATGRTASVARDGSGSETRKDTDGSDSFRSTDDGQHKVQRTMGPEERPEAWTRAGGPAWRDACTDKKPIADRNDRARGMVGAEKRGWLVPWESWNWVSVDGADDGMRRGWVCGGTGPSCSFVNMGT
ncbi:hypothetical protein VTK73DRAFT_3727 [Phialemonium thermophilum]|uniref:Uncharacterized protein n=1 Tax=Phialemonium thermophilum TaxID=223376 RepID=A0ABR3VFM7_9PEZI